MPSDFNIEVNELPIVSELQPELEAEKTITYKKEKRIRKHPSKKSTKKKLKKIVSMVVNESPIF